MHVNSIVDRESLSMFVNVPVHVQPTLHAMTLWNDTHFTAAVARDRELSWRRESYHALGVVSLSIDYVIEN